MRRIYLVIGLFAASTALFALSAFISLIKLSDNDVCKADLDGCIRYAAVTAQIAAV
jgi:hypothetical protein